MNEQQRAVVQQALWVVRELMDGEHTYEALERADNAIFALRQLLEQPEPVQEPVKPYAYEYGRDNGDGTYSVVIEKRLKEKNGGAV